MGRSRSGVDENKRTFNEPYPSSPTRPPKYNFTLRYNGKYASKAYYSLYAAKKEIETYINGQPYKWVSKRCITCENGLTIQSHSDDHLEELIEHNYSPQEKEWQIPSNLLSDIERFLATPLRVVPISTWDTDIPVKEPKKVISTRKKSDGLTSIASIAEELQMDPREARAALRVLKIVKPEVGWAWDETEVEKIKEKLRTYKR